MTLVRLTILTAALYLVTTVESLPQNDNKDEGVVDGNVGIGDAEESKTVDASTQKQEQANSDKIKRDLPIVGPIPTKYHGQATGHTTFDGVEAADFELPDFDSHEDGESSEENEWVRGHKRPGQFQPQRRPSSANANRGPLAFPKKKRQSFDASEFNPQHRNDYQFATRVQNFGAPLDLTLPSTTPSVHDVFSTNEWFDNQQLPKLSTRDGSLFQPETPQQRFDRITNEYTHTLAEYQISLIKFQEELRKYSAITNH